jgi:hypothetical protein
VGPTVWLAVDTLEYPRGGGHLWVYLNWALGLRSLGCEVVWMEPVHRGPRTPDAPELIADLRTRLAPYGLDQIALCGRGGSRLKPAITEGTVDLEVAAEADLLLNLAYDACAAAIPLFSRTALIDIDPGLVQVWLADCGWALPPHDVYFTTSEAVGRRGGRIPDAGIDWQLSRPCVAVDSWPASPSTGSALFSTVSHWSGYRQWFTQGRVAFSNSKREGFLPFLNLPSRTSASLELALCLGKDDNDRLLPSEEQERRSLEQAGWSVVHAHDVAATPDQYKSYIHRSAGEFSCVKPSCVYLQNAWISDRSLCYLASGRPVVVQDTGPSDLLPDGEGVHRFRDVAGAARCLERVLADFEGQQTVARRVAEENFDARSVVASVLERAL